MEKQYTEEIEKLGGIIYTHLGKDLSKATEAVRSLNGVLERSPNMLKFLTDKENQAVFAEMVDEFKGKDLNMKSGLKMLKYLGKLKM